MTIENQIAFFCLLFPIIILAVLLGFRDTTKHERELDEEQDHDN